MNSQIASAIKLLEGQAAQVRETVEGAVKTGQERAGQAAALVVKGLDKLTVNARENVDAVLVSGRVVSDGAEAAGEELVAYTRASVEQSLNFGRSVLAAKSPKEVAELQLAFVKLSLEAGYAEAVRLSRLSAKVAQDAVAPIGARVNAAVQSLNLPVAA